MKKVGLVFGGRSVEHAVSVASARNVARGLEEAGYAVVPLGIGPDGCWVDIEIAAPVLGGKGDRLPPGDAPVRTTLSPLLEAEVDVVFPIVHGTWGEDGTLQGLCEMLDLPYVGTGVSASAIAMDKILCKQLLQANGIPVVEYGIVTKQGFERSETAALRELEDLRLPLFVKPAIGGSSVGVSKVQEVAALPDAIREGLRFDERLLIERGVVGREIECSVLGYRTIESSVLGEIVPGKDFYDYTDKYLDDGAQLIAPAELAATLAEEIRRTAIAAFEVIGGQGMARVDFLLEGDDDIYVNEINSHPGFTDISMYPRLWGLTGLPLAGLVDRLVLLALDRHADRQELDSGIKDWLASLDSQKGEDQG